MREVSEIRAWFFCSQQDNSGGTNLLPPGRLVTCHSISADTKVFSSAGIFVHLTFTGLVITQHVCSLSTHCSHRDRTIAKNPAHSLPIHKYQAMSQKDLPDWGADQFLRWGFTSIPVLFCEVEAMGRHPSSLPAGAALQHSCSVKVSDSSHQLLLVRVTGDQVIWRGRGEERSGTEREEFLAIVDHK